MTRALLGASLAAAIFLSGCGGREAAHSADGLLMDRGELERYVQVHLDNTHNFGHISSVTCDAGLEDREDAATNCSLRLAYDYEEPVQVTVVRDKDGNLSPGLTYVSRSS